jgi:hypothetical protein
MYYLPARPTTDLTFNKQIGDYFYFLTRNAAMFINKILSLLLLIFICGSCKKENAAVPVTLEGSWHITQIQGINGFTGAAGLDFVSGEFTFKENYVLEYLDPARKLCTGSWSLNNIQQVDNCVTGTDGSSHCDYFWEITLNMEAELTPGSLQKRKAYFEFFKFSDATHFTATLSPGGALTHEYSFARFK